MRLHIDLGLETNLLKEETERERVRKQKHSSLSGSHKVSLCLYDI